jgi:DNA polymerase-3 subunit alpha
MNPLQIALSVRSDYSLGESSFQIDKIIARAKEAGLTHVALVDYMSVSSMPTFSEAAKKAGLTPIVGCTLQIVDDPVAKMKDRENNGYRLKVYVKGDAGLRALFAALTKSLTPDHFYYHARLGLDDVLALDDVIVTSGDLHSLWKHPSAHSIHHSLKERFGADYYTELVAIDTPLFDRLNAIALGHGPDERQVIVTRPAFYATPDDADATDVLKAISSNTQMDSIFLAKPFNRDLCLLAPKDMAVQSTRALLRACMDHEDGGYGVVQTLKNAAALATKCTYAFAKLAPSMPKMAENEFSALMLAVKAGWARRFSAPVWGHQPSAEDLEGVYRERLKFELGVLQRMGFSGYFLLVQDIVQWSKENGVMVGPGRGSSAGSLVAYLMGITDADPIRFGLLFERFINPDRLDLPDADLDFESGKRHMVIDYIISKYGRENVAGIVNFSTLGAASALRDTARLHGLEPWEYSCSKQMEKDHGVSVGLLESAERVPDIDKFRKERPILWDHALRLEGANRSLSQHAAGIVVAGEPVIQRAVVSTKGELPVVQWDKRQVENFGLIKMDILGLNTLDLIDLAFTYIKERHHKTINMLALPLDDKRVLAAFGKGDTVGAFQFSGGGMRTLLKDMATSGPLDFNDLCAATALFRPGPLDAGLCDRYVQVKKGLTSPFYEHPILEECLGDTFGVIVYQEQVMKVCRLLSGMTPGEADGVRKAMGKKDAVKMAEYKEVFIAGAEKSGMAASQADTLWETIAGFAGYGFNKSHAAAYSLISWVTMWLKVYYPAEFYAAAMTVIDKEDQLTSLVADAQARKLQILPPDLNKSSARIEIEGEDKLYAPFQSVKGISSNVAASLVKLRAHMGGRFTYDPATKVVNGLDPAVQKLALGRTQVNVRHRETLGKVGAFHALDGEGVAPMHPSRLKDRIELMPGFTVEMVKPDRLLNAEHLAKIKITSMIEEIRGCEGCSLKGQAHPLPRMGDAPKFFLVFDTPNWKEERAGKMLEGDAADVVKAALKGVGMKAADGYYTSLVRAVKPKDQKVISNEQISNCSKWLERELEILKPPVIIAMGSNAVRYFTKGMKGTPTDLAGKVIFDKERDASIILGINPGSIFFDPSKITLVEKVFATLGEMLS